MAEEKRDWWPPNQIIFSVRQVIWLLINWTTLRDGCWPLDSKATGYEDGTMACVIKMGRSRRRGQRAPFELPCQVYAELSGRLDQTGVDGKLLLAEVQAGVVDMESLQYESKRALKYLLGRDKKALSYSQWKAQRAYRLSIKR